MSVRIRRPWVKISLGVLAAVLVIVGIGVQSLDADQAANPRSEFHPGPLKRIILLKFESGLTPEKIKELTDGIVLLKHKIPAIASLDVLENTNTDNDYYVSKGFTHVVLVTFNNAKDRGAFLIDPIHKAYETQVLVPRLKDFLVVEYILPSK